MNFWDRFWKWVWYELKVRMGFYDDLRYFLYFILKWNNQPQRFSFKNLCMAHDGPWFDCEEFWNWDSRNCMIVKGIWLSLKIWLWGIFENLAFTAFFGNTFELLVWFGKFWYFIKLWVFRFEILKDFFICEWFWAFRP